MANVRDDRGGGTALHNVIDVDEARRLIQQGADVHATDDLGCTPLHYAWSASIATVLLDHGAHVDSRDQHGKTPLHMAQDAACADLFLDRGADVDAVDDDGETPMWHAAADDRDDVVQRLCERNANIRALNKDGESILNATVKCRQPHHRATFYVRIARLLIRLGAPIDARFVEWITEHTSYLLISAAELLSWMPYQFFNQSQTEHNAVHLLLMFELASRARRERDAAREKYKEEIAAIDLDVEEMWVTIAQDCKDLATT